MQAGSLFICTDRAWPWGHWALTATGKGAGEQPGLDWQSGRTPARAPGWARLLPLGARGTARVRAALCTHSLLQTLALHLESFPFCRDGAVERGHMSARGPAPRGSQAPGGRPVSSRLYLAIGEPGTVPFGGAGRRCGLPVSLPLESTGCDKTRELHLSFFFPYK